MTIRSKFQNSAVQERRFPRLIAVRAAIFILLIFSAGCASRHTVIRPESPGEQKEMNHAEAKTFEDSGPLSHGNSDKAEGPRNLRNKSLAPMKREPCEIRTVGNEKDKNPPLPSRRIHFNMIDVELSLLLGAMARIADISMVISENVKGKITMNIKDEPWDGVFHSILKTYGLDYEWEGGIVRVLSIDDISQDFRRLEMHQKREAKKREIENIAPLENAVIEIHYADAENLREIFEKFLEKQGEEERGAVMIDRHTQSLIVQGTKNEIDAIRTLVARLDRPTHQIRIEAQIVEASSDTARELGFEWGGQYQGGRGDKKYWVTPGINSAADGEGIVISDGDISNSLVSAPGLMQRLPSETLAESGLMIGFVAEMLDEYTLAFQLSALEEAGKLNILSSPSISTLDNQSAVIESGREVPYQTRDEDNELTIEFKKAVLSLEVTPHVIDDSLMKMKILTHKDELDFSSSTSVQGNPTMITKKAETSVMLRDGETMVIGGLKKESLSEGEAGVPVLKDIPILGHLFRRDRKSSDKEEILIFITPHIVRK